MKPLESPIAVVEGEDKVEGDRLRTMLFHSAPHRSGGLVQCRVPPDRLPPQIRIAFRAGAAKRPRRMVDQLRCGAALGTERPVGCPGSGSRRTKRPFSTTVTAPHRAMQSAQ
jgi:hypothetical protein